MFFFPKGKKTWLGGGFNPVEKYQSKWEIFPNFRGEHKKYSKPPPGFLSSITDPLRSSSPFPGCPPPNLIEDSLGSVDVGVVLANYFFGPLQNGRRKIETQNWYKFLYSLQVFQKKNTYYTRRAEIHETNPDLGSLFFGDFQLEPIYKDSMSCEISGY